MQIGGLMSEAESAEAPRKVHFILNSKGGVGKSFIAFLLAQYYRHIGAPMLCFDADATTATFSSFAALNVTRVLLMDEGRVLNTRKFDGVVEAILTEDANIVVDTGTSSFVALSHYLIENDIHAQIHEAGKQVTVHAIIIGAGRTLPETLSDLDDLATQLPDEVEIVVWLNEHFGLIRQDGKGFEQMKAYQTHRERIGGIVRLPQRTADTFGEDVKEMIRRKLTFGEAIASPEFTLISKQRLKMIERDVYQKLEAVL